VLISLRQYTTLQVLGFDRHDFLTKLALPVRRGALPPPFVIERARIKIQRGDPHHWWAPFMVVQELEGAVVGGCAFKGLPESGRVNILYGVSAECRRQGIATAIVDELAALAFAHGANEVLAEIEPRNLPSARTVEKCGFKNIGTYIAHDGVTITRWVLCRQLA
jgi:RimJ/RimL family protein N-acetyltransferase